MSSEGLIELRSELDRDLDNLLAGGDPMAVAVRWKELGRAMVTRWLVDILAERLRKSALGGPDIGRQGGTTAHFSRLLSMLDRCLEARSGVLTRSNSNEQLALERLALGIALERTGELR